MPLIELSLPDGPTAMPADVRSFLREAERRTERFQRDNRAPAFVPSDFALAYRALRVLATSGLVPGNLFCEWGSGFGLVACLAAMLEFDAYGIEIEGELVDAARELAADFGLPVEFVHGSFIPAGSADCAPPGAEFAWLTTDGHDAHAEMGLGPEDFGGVFAYPWPDEEGFTAALFERHAAVGAVLVTYHGADEMLVRRKKGQRSRRQARGRR